MRKIIDKKSAQELECGEANGFPGHPWYDPVNCDGKFVRHHTFVKDRTKGTTADSVMQAFVDIMKTGFATGREELVVSEKEELEKTKIMPDMLDGKVR